MDSGHFPFDNHTKSLSVHVVHTNIYTFYNYHWVDRCSWIISPCGHHLPISLCFGTDIVYKIFINEV